MLLTDDGKSYLKDWLNSRFTHTGISTDADVLADYTLALLERDLDTSAHKKYIIGELELFIDTSHDFTEELFKVIAGIENVDGKTGNAIDIDENNVSQSDEENDDEYDNDTSRNNRRSHHQDVDDDKPVLQHHHVQPAPQHEHHSHDSSADILSKPLSSRYEPDRRDRDNNRKRSDYNDRNRHGNDQDSQHRRHNDRNNNIHRHQPSNMSPQQQHQYPPMRYPMPPYHMSGPNAPPPWHGFPPYHDAMPKMNPQMFYPPPPGMPPALDGNYPPMPNASMPPSGGQGPIPWYPYPMQHPHPDAMMMHQGQNMFYDGPYHGNIPPPPQPHHRSHDQSKDRHRNHDRNRDHQNHHNNNHNQASNLSMGYKPSQPPASESNDTKSNIDSLSGDHQDMNQLNPLAEEYVPTASDDMPSTMVSPEQSGYYSYAKRGSIQKTRGSVRPIPVYKPRGWNRYALSSEGDIQTPPSSSSSSSAAVDDIDTSSSTSSSSSQIANQETIQYESSALSPPKPAVEVKITKENVVMQQKYEDLKKLRTQVDDIWKKKESLIQVQIDKIRDMVGKLEGGDDHNSANAEMVGNLESKLINLQAQLQDVRAQRDTGTLSHQIHQENAPASSNPSYDYAGGGRGRFASRGRHTGRFAARGSSSSLRGGRSFGRGRFQWVNNNSSHNNNNNHTSSNTTSQQDNSDPTYDMTSMNDGVADNPPSEVVAQ